MQTVKNGNSSLSTHIIAYEFSFVKCYIINNSIFLRFLFCLIRPCICCKIRCSSEWRNRGDCPAVGGDFPQAAQKNPADDGYFCKKFSKIANIFSPVRLRLIARRRFSRTFYKKFTANKAAAREKCSFFLPARRFSTFYYIKVRYARAVTDPAPAGATFGRFAPAPFRSWRN